MNIQGAQVHAAEGGPRGLRVTVTLGSGDDAALSAIKEALSAYLFETVIKTG
jgi:fatty-acyl-CoA synthase